MLQVRSLTGRAQLRSAWMLLEEFNHKVLRHAWMQIDLQIQRYKYGLACELQPRTFFLVVTLECFQIRAPKTFQKLEMKSTNIFYSNFSCRLSPWTSSMGGVRCWRKRWSMRRTRSRRASPRVRTEAIPWTAAGTSAGSVSVGSSSALITSVSSLFLVALSPSN